MSNSIKLTYPVKDSGETVSTVTLRRPKVRDMISSDGDTSSDAEKEVRLFASLCNLPPAVIEELDLADYQKLQKTYAGFLD